MDIQGARRAFQEFIGRVDAFTANAKSGRPVQTEVDRLLFGLESLRGQINEIASRAPALRPATVRMIKRLDQMAELIGPFKRLVDERVRRSSHPPPPLP